jgi:hypothetical protein
MDASFDSTGETSVVGRREEGGGSVEREIERTLKSTE